MAERCLNHAVDGKVTQAYQRYEYAPQKAAIMEAWFLWLVKAKAPGKLDAFFPDM